MAARGYTGATIAQVARQAQLRPGLVHYHFANKREILLELVERISLRIEQRFQARVQPQHSAEERLLALVDAHVALGADADPDAVASWVTIGAEAVHQPEVRELYEAALTRRVELLKRLFSEALRQRGRSARGAAEMAAAVCAAIEGAFQLSAAAPSVVPRGFAARSLRKMVGGLLQEEA